MKGACFKKTAQYMSDLGFIHTERNYFQTLIFQISRLCLIAKLSIIIFYEKGNFFKNLNKQRVIKFEVFSVKKNILSQNYTGHSKTHGGL